MPELAFPGLNLLLLRLLVLAQLHLQTPQLRLGRLEPVLYRVQFLGLDHVERLVLEVLLVRLSSLLRVPLLELRLVLVPMQILVLQLLGQSLPLAPLERVQLVRVHEPVRVVAITALFL